MDHTITMKKIRWLQKHYMPYSSVKYLEDLRKIDTIYRKEYTKYIQSRCIESLRNRGIEPSSLSKSEYGTSTVYPEYVRRLELYFVPTDTALHFGYSEHDPHLPDGAKKLTSETIPDYISVCREHKCEPPEDLHILKEYIINTDIHNDIVDGKRDISEEPDYQIDLYFEDDTHACGMERNDHEMWLGESTRPRTPEELLCRTLV